METRSKQAAHHKQTKAYRPNFRPHRHFLRNLLPLVFPELCGYTRTYFLDCRGMREPRDDAHHGDPAATSKKHTGRSPPMMETNVHTEEWREILVRTHDFMMRNSEEMLRDPFYKVDALLIYICGQGTHRSEELRMAVTAALQAMGGNVVMSKQLCGRDCVWGAHHTRHSYNVPAAAPCKYCSCNEWTHESYTVFANCVLTSARHMMNHRIRAQSAERFVGRKVLQPSANAVRDRGRTVDPAGDRRSSAASASQAGPIISDGGAFQATAEIGEPIATAKAVHEPRVAAPKARPPDVLGGKSAPPKRSPDHPLAKTKASVPKPPPPPGPTDTADDFRARAGSELSIAVERSRTEARKESRASPKASNYIRTDADLPPGEPHDAITVMERDVAIECINRIRKAFSQPGEPIPADYQFPDPNEPWNTLRNILPPFHLQIEHVRMIAKSVKEDWNKQAEEDVKRQEEGRIAHTEMMARHADQMARAKETARTRAEAATTDAQQGSTESSPAARAQPDSAPLPASTQAVSSATRDTRRRSRGPATRPAAPPLTGG